MKTQWLETHGFWKSRGKQSHTSNMILKNQLYLCQIQNSKFNQ